MEILAIIVVGVVLIAGTVLTFSQARALGRLAHTCWNEHAETHLIRMAMRSVRNGKAGI